MSQFARKGVTRHYSVPIRLLFGSLAEVSGVNGVQETYPGRDQVCMIFLSLAAVSEVQS